MTCLLIIKCSRLPHRSRASPRKKNSVHDEELLRLRVRTCLQFLRRRAKFSAVTSVDEKLKYVKLGMSHCILSPLVFDLHNEWVSVGGGEKYIYCQWTIRSIFRVFREETARASLFGYGNSISTSLRSRNSKFFI